MDSPLISVIVVCKDPGPGIGKTIDSILEQTAPLTETIVIDGASKDGTREWLYQHQHLFGYMRSEPDEGVYDAMNKGIAQAKGTWIIFMGAGDQFCQPDTLLRAAITLTGSFAAVIAGAAYYDNKRCFRTSSHPNRCARNFLHHQATFYRRDLFIRFGQFDTSFSIMGDYELNLRLWHNAVVVLPVSLDIARCSSGGISDRGKWRGYSEEIRVRHRYFPGYFCFLWDTISVARYIRKKIVYTFFYGHFF